MSKELEEMQSALNKLDFYIWDIKETTNFEKQANKQIEILQKGLDNLKSSVERKEKLEKAWKIVCEKNVDMFTLRYCNTLFDYQVELMKEGIHTDLTETEFNLLKEMLK